MAQRRSRLKLIGSILGIVATLLGIVVALFELKLYMAANSATSNRSRAIIQLQNVEFYTIKINGANAILSPENRIIVKPGTYTVEAFFGKLCLWRTKIHLKEGEVRIVRIEIGKGLNGFTTGED